MEDINREDCMETSEKDGVVSKEIRRRKKRLLNQITNQMEFYFSSANITKDKFMSDLLCHDPYIDLVTFFKFNKIRAMTSDIDFLRKAITKSSVLKLSDDGMRVRRMEEEKPKYDEVQCTIYVENVPSNADHEWVREVFGAYGTIDYISLPRYHRSGRPKGFAFVEFKTQEMANSALEAFGALECKIPPTTDPAELQSIKTFEGNEGQGEVIGEGDYDMGGKMEKESDVESKNKIKIDCTKNEDIKEINVEINSEEMKENDGVMKKKKNNNAVSEEVEGKSIKKRKRSTSEEEKKEMKGNNDSETREGTIEIDENKEGRKLKEEDNAKTKEGLGQMNEREGKKRKLDATEETEEKKKRKINEKTTSENDEEDIEGKEEEEEEEEHVTGGGKKKKRKRKRKKKEKEVIDSIYLRVMSKEDWKRLRNKYLNSQRENMKVLKMQMQEQYHNYHPHHHHHHHHYHQSFSRRQIGDSNVRFDTEEYRNQNREGEESSEREEGIGKDDWKAHDLTDKREQKMGKNYAKCQDEIGKNSDYKNNESLKPQFTPNSVIKISFEEPPHDVKKLRETIREGGGGGVAYVDLSPTERDVYVRFTSSNGASAYKSTGCWSRMELLSGEEEEEYWRKIITCWTERRSKKNKNKRGQNCGGEMRGREKLLQKAFQDAQNTRKCSSHIVFEV